MGINKVQYGNTTLIDLTSDTVTADKLMQGYTAHDRTGALITGTATGGGRIWKDENGYVHLSDDGNLVGVEPLTVTENGTYTAPTGKAYSPVIVNVELQPSGVKYLYSDVDGEGAWTGLSGYEYVSYDYAPVKDGKTRLWVRFDDHENLTASVYIYYGSSTPYTISWGDGNSDSATGSGHTRLFHSYADIGVYAIEIDNGGAVSNYITTNGSDTVNNSLCAAEIVGNPATKNAVFRNCQTLKKCYFDEGTVSIGMNYFYGCFNLKDIHLPSSLTTISISAFRECTSLTTLTIPSAVTNIGDYVITDCGNNTVEVHMRPTVPPSISANTFVNIRLGGTAISAIYVPSASLEAYQTATNWSTYASYMVGE